MALNNGYAGAARTARRHAKLQKRAALTSSSSPPPFQLFLGQHQRTHRTSTSPEVDPKSALRDKSLTTSLAHPSRNRRSLSSLPSKPKRSDLSKPLAPSKLAKLSRRHRSLERAPRSFLLRRQLWRRTRKPFFNMDFIEHIRRIQADEPSSDEESGSSLSHIPGPISRRQSSAPTTADPAAPAAPAQLDEPKPSSSTKKRDSAAAAPAAPAQLDEPKPSSSKKKRDSAAATTEEALTEGAPKKVKGTEPSGAGSAKKAKDQAKPPAAASTPAPLADGTKGPKKRARMDEDKATEREQRATKRAKSAPAKMQAESSKETQAAAPPAAQKPVDKMEYFERRVHDMLTDPLDFDDCVYDSTKPTPRHVARSFARNRRAQKQPPPPLEMSGAAGPAPDAKPAATTPKTKGSGGLAKEAQKRAHQLKVKGHVERLKGKAAAEEEEGPEEGRTKGGLVGGKQSVGGKQAGKAKANVGKRKERAWLTNARGGDRGGQQPQVRVKKYTQSAYFAVPTMSSAIAPGQDMSAAR